MNIGDIVLVDRNPDGASVPAIVVAINDEETGDADLYVLDPARPRFMRSQRSDEAIDGSGRFTEFATPAPSFPTPSHFLNTVDWGTLVVAGGEIDLIQFTFNNPVEQHLELDVTFQVAVTVDDIRVAVLFDAATETIWGVSGQGVNVSLEAGPVGGYSQFRFHVVSTLPIAAGDGVVTIRGSVQAGGAGGTATRMRDELVTLRPVAELETLAP